jgi:hypothetical protein
MGGKALVKSKKGPYLWGDEFLRDEVDYLQERAVTKIKEADKNQESAEESRQKYEILEEKALEISKNMQSIPPGHWAYGYLKKEAEEKEQEAKQIYRQYIRKVKSQSMKRVNSTRTALKRSG